MIENDKLIYLKPQCTLTSDIYLYSFNLSSSYIFSFEIKVQIQVIISTNIIIR